MLDLKSHKYKTADSVLTNKKIFLSDFWVSAELAVATSGFEYWLF